MSVLQYPDLGSCDFCGQPVGFYGCPTHGTDCYDESAEGNERAVVGPWRTAEEKP